MMVGWMRMGFGESFKDVRDRLPYDVSGSNAIEALLQYVLDMTKTLNS